MYPCLPAFFVECKETFSVNLIFTDATVLLAFLLHFVVLKHHHFDFAFFAKLSFYHAYITCFQTVPSAAPAINNVTSQTSTSILISFSAIQASLINGVLSGYLVTVRAGVDKRTIKTNDTSITVMSLRKATPYDVYVQACSRVGCGPNSSPFSVTTLEDGKL